MSTALVLADTRSRSAAATWIRARWDGWLELGSEFPGLMQRASRVAAATSDPATKRAAKDSIERTSQLWNLHALTTEKARQVAGLIPGLGSLQGFLWPAAIIAVALSIAWVTTRYNAERGVVRMLEEGNLTPDDARQLLSELEGGPLISGGGGLAVSAVGLIGVGLFLWAGTRGPRGS